MKRQGNVVTRLERARKLGWQLRSKAMGGPPCTQAPADTPDSNNILNWQVGPAQVRAARLLVVALGGHGCFLSAARLRWLR